MEAKTLGTLIIDELIDSMPIDFFMLCSSVAAYFFTGGQSAYAAANSFIDSFTAQKRRNGKPYCCINWTTWEGVGMAADQGLQIDTIFKLLSPEKAVKGLADVLQNGMSNVIVGALNYDGIYYPLIKTYTLKISDAIQEIRNQVKPEEDTGKNLENKRSAANDRISVEENILRVYKELLDFKDVDVDDSFFELGGNSILLNQAFDEINRLYPNTIKAADLFSYTTISSLSEYIAMQLNMQKDGNKRKAEKETRQNYEQCENSETTLSAEDALEQLERL